MQKTQRKIARWRFWVIFRRLSKVALSRFARFALGGFTPKRFARFAFFALCGANLATLNAYDFSKCKEFYLNTSQIFTLEISANGVDSTKEIRAFHIGNGKYLAFLGEGIDNITNENVLFYDRFVGLALFSDKKMTPKYDLLPITKSVQSLPLAGITSDSTTQGKILSTQKSLKNKAQFSHEIPPNAVISDICYQSYGISAGANRFIDKAYITRFLRDFQAKKGAKIYSDIGFSVKMQNGALVVETLNPFAFGFESLQIGDEILAINGIAVKNDNDFFDIASNLEVGKSAQVTIKRSEAIKRHDSINKSEAILTIRAIPFKRERGFGESGTALDIFGIIIDDNLLIQKAPPNAIFQKNDRILRLSQIKIYSKADLDNAIWRVLETKSDFSFLISRKDFEFFITFKNEVK